MTLIDKEQAYQTLSEYYHHRMPIQHMALKEALGRVPVVDAIPMDWIMKYYEDHPASFVCGMIYDWAMEQAEEKKNEI